MSDVLRTDGSRAIDAASDSERDAKIEQLLLAGLDHYFAARYDQAINVWTRALFLDRSHARARAYIDRARSALAERHRESEELLQNAVAALQGGEAQEARRLLNLAIDRGAPADDAAPLLDRLDRVQQQAVVSVPAPTDRPPRARPLAPRDVGARRAGSGLAWLADLGALLAGATLLLLATRPAWGPVLGPSTATATGAMSGSADGGLPLPRRGEIALARAQALTAAGRLRDALATLDLVHPTDEQRGEADRLRAEIQRRLIGMAESEAQPRQSERSEIPRP